MGPNHKDGCNGNTWWYSGDGYNRVKVCACGAEDHAPEKSSLFDLLRNLDGFDVIAPEDDESED